MKPKTMILMVVAVVCGLAAMYMTNRLLADKTPPPPVNTVKVLVSKSKINAYLPMKKPEDLFEVKEVPEGTYSPKCITDFKDLKDQALKQSLNEEMPVTKDDLLTAETSGLIGNLKEGQRATAIRVTPESLAGGFVLPGSKVDVMFIMKRGDEDSKTQIILQDMLVLAVDMKNTRQEGDNSMLGTTATLATSAEEAEELALAASLGDLRLMLRTPLDTDKPKYKAVTMKDLGRTHHSDADGKPDTDDPNTTTPVVAALPPIPKVEKAPTPPPPPVEKVVEAPPPPVTHTLRIESGDTITKTVFVWDAKNSCWEGGEPTQKPDAVRPADAPRSDEAPKSKDAAPPADAPKPQKAPTTAPDKNPSVG